jgi:anti-sigma factor RsiW
MNCAQVKEQLIDFLYGELPAEARSSFTEHLQGCPACKAEVASYQHTLGSTRAALGGPLLEEAPARVHLAVIEAAQAAAQKHVTPAKVQGPSSQDDLGFFARLWRTPWFLPAFGAASIATVVFLVRVLKNPEVLPGQRPHSIEERSLVAPEPAPSPEPTMAAQPAAATAAAVEANADMNLDEAKRSSSTGRATKHAAAKEEMARVQAPAGLKRKASAEMQDLGSLKLENPQAGAARQFVEPPPPRPATKKSSKDLDDLMGGFKDAEDAPPSARPMRAPAGGKPDRARGEEDRFQGKAEKAAGPAKDMLLNEPAADMAKPATHSPARSAGVPASAAAPAPAYAPSPAAPRMRDYPAESAASAPATSPPPAVKRKARVQSDEEGKGSAVVTDDDSAQETDHKKAKSGDKTGPSLDESIRKAERLYASQDWGAAAAAYRDLISRFPGHKDAPRWRDRMNESNVAYQRTLEAKRKKARTDDPRSGSMK